MNVTKLPWRVGRSLGRTVYAQVSEDPTKSDMFLGIFDSKGAAQYVVDLHNKSLREVNDGDN